MSVHKERILKQANLCAKGAAKQLSNLSKLRKMIEKEYGVIYNDVDCDPIIDSCEIIGGGFNSVAEIDEALYGYSRVPRDRDIARKEMGEEYA